jgi:malonyl-CoA/methylmalonyl-CoA synthetase
VLESAVIGVPHPDFGEGVVGVIVPGKRPGSPEEAIMASIKDRVARFKQPKKIYMLDELPRNTMGKVQKNILRDCRQAAVTGKPCGQWLRRLLKTTGPNRLVSRIQTPR